MSDSTDTLSGWAWLGAQLDVPRGRNGKHKEIVTRILSDLDQLHEGSVLKVPLAELEGKQGKAEKFQDLVIPPPLQRMQGRGFPLKAGEPGRWEPTCVSGGGSAGRQDWQVDTTCPASAYGHWQNPPLE